MSHGVDEKQKGFLKDFIFHIRAEDLLPNDLKNLSDKRNANVGYKVLISANKFGTLQIKSDLLNTLNVFEKEDLAVVIEEALKLIDVQKIAKRKKIFFLEAQCER